MLTEAQKLYLSDLPIELALAWLIWGEAEGETVAGMIAVANVPFNRVRRRIPARWGSDLRGVMLWPLAFQGLARVPIGFGNINDVTGTNAFKQANTVAIAAVVDGLADLSMGATHFHLWDDPASWREAPTMHFTKRIGSHLFYREE